jgi:hypothetical protein
VKGSGYKEHGLEALPDGTIAVPKGFRFVSRTTEERAKGFGRGLLLWLLG